TDHTCVHLMCVNVPHQRPSDHAHKVVLHGNLRTITAAIRKAGIRVFIVPHRRWEPGDYEGWAHPSPYQVGSGEKQMFAEGSWGRSEGQKSELQSPDHHV